MNNPESRTYIICNVDPKGIVLCFDQCGRGDEWNGLEESPRQNRRVGSTPMV